MRPNRKLIRKLENVQQFLLLFVFSSIVTVIYAGVVRRETIDDKIDNSSHHNDDVFAETVTGPGTITTTASITQPLTTLTTANLSSADNVTLHPIVAVTATTKNIDELSTSTTTIAPAAQAPAPAETDPSPLSIARVTANDIKKPQTTLAQNNKKLNHVEGDDNIVLKAPTAEVRIESTTISPSVESQSLQVTTFDSIAEQKQRKGKMITDTQTPVLIRGITITTTTTTSTELNTHSKIIAVVRESSSDNIAANSNSSVIQIQKSVDKSGNVVNNFHNNISDHYGTLNTERNLKTIAAETEDTVAVSTELPHFDYNSEHTEDLFEQSTTESSDISFITTEDYRKYTEDSTQSTVGFESISLSNYDHHSNDDDDDEIDEEITTSSNIFDSTTIDNKIEITVKNNKNKSSIIINSKVESTNDDVSTNEIKNSSLITDVNSVVNNNVTRRGSKFIKGEANMTIPDAAEVWALASLKNVVDNKNVKDTNKNGHLVVNDGAENITSIKIKPNRNETTSTKLLVDWSKIMKEVQVGEESDNQTNNANVNSVENAVENTINIKSKTATTAVTFNTNDLSSSLPPTKSSLKQNNETLQELQVIPTLSSTDDEEKEKRKQEKSETVDKNQVDDMEQFHQQQLNLEESSKQHSSENEQQNAVITSSTMNTMTSTSTSTTEATAQQVTKAVTDTTLPSVSRGNHLFVTSNDSSPNKVKSTDTGVTHKGTPNYKEITSETSSFSLTTEAISSQSAHFPNLTSFEDTTLGDNLKPIVKIESTEHELLSSLLPSTETDLVSSTTVRVPRTSSTTPKISGNSTTVIPISSTKSVSKNSTKQSEFSEPKGTDNSFATGPENSIESNTIDRVAAHTTPSDQSAQDTKVAPTVSTTTTAKINVFPVETNSVEHFGQGSTSTHKTVPTKAEQEYSIHNVPKAFEPTSKFPYTLHNSTDNPHHVSGPMPDDTSMPPEETDYNVIIAISISVVGIIALILLVGFLYVMRKRQKQLTYGQRCRPVSLDAYSLDNVSVYNSVRRKGALRASKRSYGNVAFDDPSLKHNLLNIQELAKFVEKKSSIYEEFKDVPQITARADEVPAGCEDKNRYANVIPLPETRVILQRQNDDEKTEYINANYVRGPKDAPNYYIACQAPLESTVVDFWRMIWEQNSRVIIMATDLIENGIEKCTEYLPTSIALENHITCGDFQITLKSREVKEKYAVSVLHLKNTTTNVWREITHFWYQWPETGAPNDEAGVIAMLLEARSCLKASPVDQIDDNECNENMTKTNENLNGSEMTTNGSVVKSSQKTQGPLTVHCSPGTGRTGTIISCDIVLRSLETPKRSVDIPQIVYYVRRGRASSVQTKEQYEFIYRIANMYASKISGSINDN